MAIEKTPSVNASSLLTLICRSEEENLKSLS